MFLEFNINFMGFDQHFLIKKFVYFLEKTDLSEKTIDPSL